jgi:pilus assembly protein CpaC
MAIKKIALCFWLVPFLLLMNTPSLADPNMNLYVGQVKPVYVGKVSRVAVGKDSVLQTVILDDGKILFIPTAAGETDVKVWLKNGKYIGYHFNILAENMGSKKVIAHSLLRAFPGLRVVAVDKHIIVEGKISPVDQKTYENVIAKIENVVSLVNPNKFNEYQARQLLKAFDIQGVQIKKAGKRLVIGGEVDPQDKKAFDAVISKIPNISSLIREKKFVKERMVRLKVRVAEIDSNYGRQLGIKWDESAAGPIFSLATPLISNDYFGIVPSSSEVGGVDFVDLLQSAPNKTLTDFRFTTSIFSRLNFLESNGKARTLSQPELLARSGAEASFSVGGELPIVFTNNDGPQVTFKPYGVSVKMKPLVNRNNEIVLDLTTEVSSVDTSNTVLGVPGIKTSNATTTINAYDGRTIAIAGLLDVTAGNDTAKIPFLGNIPVLGHLFKTKGKNFAKRELVFLVTPQLITPSNENNTPMQLRDEIKSLENFQVPLDRDIKGSSFVTDILE